MTTSETDLEKGILRIGDYIILKDTQRNAFLSAEGILLEDINTTEGTDNLIDCLFCVHLQRQYSASRDLQAFLNNFGNDVKKIEDESAKKYLLALQRGRENEKKLNDTYMKKKYGQKLSFGDIIQLFHVKSGKYLTVVPDKLAKDERENTRISLDVNGNSYSWVQLAPRFRIDKEGDRILSNAEVYLKVSERANEFIHTADRDPFIGRLREVNCALESTPWKISIYQSSVDAVDSSLLLASQLVYLVDPESRSNLCIARESLSSFEEEEEEKREAEREERLKHLGSTPNKQTPSKNTSTPRQTTPQKSSPDKMTVHRFDGESEVDDEGHVGKTPSRSGSRGGTRRTPSSTARENSDGFDLDITSVDGTALDEETEIRTVSTNRDHQYFHDSGDIILQPYNDNDIFNSNFLWILTCHSLVTGGAIAWKSETIRLRHLNTGRYLYLTSEIDDDEEMSEYYIVTTASDPEKSGTLFHITELNSTNKYLGNVKGVQLHQNGVYLERGEILEDSVSGYAIQGSRDKGNAVSLIINRYDGIPKNMSVTDLNDMQGEPIDVWSGLSIRYYLQKYSKMIVLPKHDSVSTIWPNSIKTDLEFFQFIADKMIYFCQGFQISAVNVQLGIDKGSVRLQQMRQQLMKEQDVLEHVLRIIYILIPMTEKLEKIRAEKNNRKRKKPSEEEMTALNMAQVVLTKCFEIIFYAILDHAENQMYVADFMPVLLAHLNSQPLAGKCVTEMLSKNIELQETKIGTREIKIFVDKLRSSKMNAMYLQLLQACCSCEGDGVDNNQGKVASLLFSNTNDIIIQMHADFVRSQQVTWQKPSLYIPDQPVDGSPLEGEVLITKGLPQLSLAWTTNSIDYSPLGLFGRLSVNVQELFPPNDLGDATTMVESKKSGKTENNTATKKKSNLDQKIAVANYFIAEMFLGAEMCLDRNYIAMNKFEELFPYATLVAIIKMKVSSRLKGAAVRLLMCLHIDRSPQGSSKIPCLTRTWSDIKKFEEPQLPFVEPNRKYKFGLVQQMISEHIHGMAGSKWDDLSQHMLKLLRTLAQFNFYGTNERLQDVIVPLIAALDRRKVGKGDSENSGENDGEGAVAEGVEGGGEGTIASPRKGDHTIGKGNDVEKGASATEFIDASNTKQIEGESAQEDDEEIGSGGMFGWVGRIGRGLCNMLGQIYHLKNAARVIALLDDDGEKSDTGYVPPLRYTKAPIYELQTMVEAVDILAFTQKVIEDRNISLLLRYFYAWESGADIRTPPELFEQVVLDSKQLSLSTTEFDAVMIDTLMFVHTPLVQSTLEVLMAHHSMRRILLDNAKNIQLLASQKRERQFRMVDQMLQQLEQNAETQELWGELESDADYAVNKQTKDILRELTDLCKIKRFVLEFDVEYMNDIELQDLMRNLGCFEISMKVLGLLDSVEEDENGELSEVAKNTKNICLLCNQFLYWFFLDNPKNQALGFEELDFFLDTLDDEIDSHLVIRAIFSNNETLMRQVPHALLANLVDRIVKNGKSHFYLSLFAAITHVGEKNIVENQFEIVKSLTSPGRLQKIGCFMIPVKHPDYDIKRQLMEPFVDIHRDVDLDELPSLLAYHLLFLDVLSGCTVGRLNITVVEAKVQAVFSYVDIIDSLLDPGTMLYCKIVLSKFLFNAFVEVELLIPGFEKTPAIWALLDTYEKALVEGKDELVKANEFGWDRARVHRQKIEYMIICVKVIGGFFSTYFDVTNFKSDSGSGSDPNAKKNRGSIASKLTLTHVNQLIVTFFHKIHDIYNMNSPRLSLEMKGQMLTTLNALKGQASKYIHSAVIPQQSLDFGASTSGSKMPDPIALSMHAQSATIADTAINDSYTKVDSAGAIINSLEFDNGPKLKDAIEIKLIEKYEEFITALEANTDIQYKADNENVYFISILEQLPFIADPVDADVRYEGLIKKLVSHIRENIKIINNQKRMDSRVSKTSTWIIRAFRTMIENRMGMSIYERDDEGGLEQDIAAAPVVNALNQCGATALCLDLIADGIDEKLQLEAIKLGVALLFKEGGALEVQEIMNNHLTSTDSELFFKQVRLTLQQLQAWHTWHQVIILPAGEDPKPPDEILIVRFLQLMCEGHYLPNQDIMREQLNNHISFNLLDDFVSYLNALSRIPCRTSTNAAIRLAATILEVIQGPCEGNQIHFAIKTELVETLNRMNRAKLINDCVAEEEIELKKIAIDIFQGVLEGQGEKSPVYERVLSVIHLDIIQIMSKKCLYPGLEDSEEQIILQTECVVLLQMLCNFRPSLYDELGISRNIEDIVGSGTAMIEVIWRGDIHRRFFHVPKICEYLAKSSKDQLVQDVDRGSAENKLIDFLGRSDVLYREVKHQQYLTEMGLARVFSRKNQNLATWFTFFLTIVINVVFIIAYENDNGVPTISPVYNNITTYLNILQLIVSCFTLILWIVLKSPVEYQTILSTDCTPYEAIFYTFTEPLTMYYMYYLILAFLGLFTQNYYCSLLLLDIIVKDSTTRDVLNSIVTPRKQLVMAFILIVFCVYIFAFFVFVFYRDDIAPYCDTLWLCFKFCSSYGFQNGGGIADSFSHTTGSRLILDLAFFLLILIVLLNVFLGMIIDTFSSLRADQMEKMRDTLNVCFICNIDKQIFDRASDEPDGFKTHVKIDHNMWNYLYFIFLLWEQDRDDDDGLEQYVRRAIAASDITWFPINKAMRLENIASAAELLRKDLGNQVNLTKGNLITKVDEFQNDVSAMLKQLVQTLKQETTEGADEAARRSMLEGGSRGGMGSRGTAADDATEAFSYTELESIGTVDNCLVKEMWISIERIDGLEVEAHVIEGEKLQISCRMLTDNSLHNVIATNTEEDVVYFPSHQYLSIMNNVLNNPVQEKRKVHIQLLMEYVTAGGTSIGQPVEPAKRPTTPVNPPGKHHHQSIVKSSKLIGSIELSALDLVHLPPTVTGSLNLFANHHGHDVGGAEQAHDHPHRRHSTMVPHAHDSIPHDPTHHPSHPHPHHHYHHDHHEHGHQHDALPTSGTSSPTPHHGGLHSRHHTPPTHHGGSGHRGTPPPAAGTGTATGTTPNTAANSARNSGIASNPHIVTTTLVKKLLRPDQTEVCNIHLAMKYHLPQIGCSGGSHGGSTSSSLKDSARRNSVAHK